jgi:hypothetical protein
LLRRPGYNSITAFIITVLIVALGYVLADRHANGSTRDLHAATRAPLRPESVPLSDVNHDRRINVVDLSIVLAK